MKNYCSKCRTRILTHLWVVNGKIYCGVSCQRNCKSQFEKLHKALSEMRK